MRPSRARIACGCTIAKSGIAGGAVSASELAAQFGVVDSNSVQAHCRDLPAGLAIIPSPALDQHAIIPQTRGGQKRSFGLKGFVARTRAKQAQIITARGRQRTAVALQRHVRMKPDPYKKKISRRYQAAHGVGGAPSTRGRGGRGRGTGRGTGRNLGTNAFRFEEPTDTAAENDVSEEKELKNLIDAVLDTKTEKEAFYRLKEEQDWLPDPKTDLDLKDINFERLKDLVGTLPQLERLGLVRHDQSQ